MVTVCNNLGADLKERSVSKSLPSLWSAAETQTRSQSSEDRAPFQASSFYLDSANWPGDEASWGVKQECARVASRKQITDNRIKCPGFLLCQWDYKTFLVHQILHMKLRAILNEIWSVANCVVSIFIIREVSTGEIKIQELTEKAPVKIEQESQKVSLCLLHVMNNPL